MSWVIAALLLPIPLFHLWFHALLSWWRRKPELLYLFGLLLWLAALWITPVIDRISPAAFMPTEEGRLLGKLLMIAGLLLPLGSLLTLGPRRFLVWEALRPQPGPAARLKLGFFRFFPHPAYLGYLVIALGNFLSSGKLYLVSVLILLLFFLPVVIWLEEEEMKKRFG